MVAPSHSPDESSPEGLNPEAGAENDLTAPTSSDANDSMPDLKESTSDAVSAPGNVPTDAVEDEADWGLRDLEPAAAAQLAVHSKADQTRLIKRLQVLAQPALKLWQRLLRGVRLRLPQVADLSDGILSGILIGILVLLLVLINSLGHPSPTAAIPASPSTEINPSEPTEPAPAELDPAPLEMNPDLERIADIQDQLAEVATSYASDLVVSVQASFAEDRLSANLSSGWYRLSRNQQDDLAADLLGRSQLLEFATLELRDPDGMKVARSPVVGSAMVILQRQPPPDVPVPERPRYSITINR